MFGVYKKYRENTLYTEVHFQVNGTWEYKNKGEIIKAKVGTNSLKFTKRK